MCEGIQTLGQSIKTVRELNTRSEKVLAECEKLEQEMEEFGQFVSSEVARVIASTPYTIRGPRKPVTVDSLSPGTEESLLPPPLLPTSSQLANMDIAPTSDTNKEEAESDLPTKVEEQEPEKDETDSPETSVIDSSPPVAPPVASISSYIGFSAQSSTIPSISCNTADSDCYFPPTDRKIN